MKKLFSLLALLCVLVCTACPVFADASGIGRQEVISGDYTDTDTSDGTSGADSDTADGSDMSDATTDSADALTNLMNGVKEKWEEIFGGLNGVLEFFTDCVAGSFGCLPAGYTVYVIMLCVCISVVAVVKALTSK